MKKIIILCSIAFTLLNNNISGMFLRRAAALKKRPFIRTCETTASFNYDELILEMQVTINTLRKENKSLIRENELLHAHINKESLSVAMQKKVALQNVDKPDNRD